MSRFTKQGNLFGGTDTVRVKRSGSVQVVIHREGPKKLTLEGGVEFARTLRNEANIEREQQNTVEGKVSK